MSHSSVIHVRFTKEACSPATSGIWGVDHPPERLFFRGSSRAMALLERVPEWGLGIVGTREPQARSLAQVREAVLELQQTNLVIISGMARGVDAMAHEAALEAGLPTIAVLGSGLNHIYPRENLQLSERILAADGLLASEFPDGMPPQPAFFIRRNRFIAGWSRATWVAEASHRSGALNTAKWARERGRDVYATPCFPGDPIFAGNQRLLDADHARPLWQAHNLGATWLSLAARTHVPGSPSNHSEDATAAPNPTDESSLTKRIHAMTQAKGGATADELLQWALSVNWSPQRFFLALQKGVHSRAIEERRGSFSSGEPSRSSPAQSVQLRPDLKNQEESD